MRNAGRVVTKTMILEHIWDYSFDPQTNVVDVLVCRLRNKIDRDFPSNSSRPSAAWAMFWKRLKASRARSASG